MASVSCIYALGDPAEYLKLSISLRKGMEIDRDEVMRRLVDIQYQRNEYDFVRGTFRAKGDVLEVFPSNWSDKVLRIEFFGDEIDAIREFQPVTGNQTGVLLLDYLIGAMKRAGKLPANAAALKTIVTTEMARAVAEANGLACYDTFTGFKFMAEKMNELESAGKNTVIFSYEESYGYLSGGHVRDKDAVNATLLVCEAAAWYAQQGKTLLDAIEALYREFGYYRNALCSFAFEGESGMHTMQELMKKLRANAPEDIAGYKVESVVDYDTDGTGLPRANVLEYHLDGGHKLMVRPSGTEPKIKVYLSAVGDSEAAADAVNAALAKAAADMMKA